MRFLRFLRFFSALGEMLLALAVLGFVALEFGACAKPYDSERVGKEISLGENLRNTLKGEIALPHTKAHTKKRR